MRRIRLVSALAAVVLALPPAALGLAGGDAPTLDLDDQGRAYVDLVAEGLGITFDEAAERLAWIEALLPLTEAVNEDRENFAELYRTDEGGTWRTVINYVGTLDAAQTRVGRLIPVGAPIEWRSVARSSAYFDDLLTGQAKLLAAELSDWVRAVGHDVVRNAISVITKGDQPAVEAQFQEAFGAVVFEQGPAESTMIAPRTLNGERRTPVWESHGTTGCSLRTAATFGAAA